MEGSFRAFYLNTIVPQLTVSPVTFEDQAVVARAFYFLDAHCRGHNRVQEDSKRLVIITSSLICLHSKVFSEHVKEGVVRNVSLDIEPLGARKMLRGYTTSQLLEKGDQSAVTLNGTSKAEYAEDWKLFRTWAQKFDKEHKKRRSWLPFRKGDSPAGSTTYTQGSGPGTTS